MTHDTRSSILFDTNLSRNFIDNKNSKIIHPSISPIKNLILSPTYIFPSQFFGNIQDIHVQVKTGRRFSIHVGNDTCYEILRGKFSPERTSYSPVLVPRGDIQGPCGGSRYSKAESIASSTDKICPRRPVLTYVHA